MQKVLIFSLAYFPHVGGAEVAVKEITDRISPEEIEFHMVTLRFHSAEPAEERIGNVVVHRVGRGSTYFSKILFVPCAAYAARILDRTHHFDMCWAMMSYMLFPLVLSGLKQPYLLTLQEGDPFEHVFRRWFILPFRPLLTAGFKHASAVQAISTFLARWARQAGFRGEPTVIPNGVDVAHFASVHPKRISKSGVSLVTTSRLVHKNAVDDIIRALRLLPDTVQFVVYGIGPEEARLRTLARTQGVEARVKFMGHISHAELPAALASCDIFVRPSRSEGMGNSFIEAMAAGLPVIATQEGGIADFLFDAKRNLDKPTTGWAVDTDSPEQIAAAVTEIVNNPDAVSEVTRAAKALVVENYDWNVVARNMRKIFSQIGAGTISLRRID